MSGRKIPDSYTDCISKWAKYSRLSFTFDFQYPDGKIRKIIYSFSISAVAKNDDDKDKVVNFDESKYKSPYKFRIAIFNEKLSMSGDFENAKKPLKPIIDTSSSSEVFEPKSKQKEFIQSEDDIEALKYQKMLSREKSISFVFSANTVQKFYDSDHYSEYFKVVLELRYFAEFYLMVVDTRSFGYIRSGLTLPIFTRDGAFMMDTMEPDILPNEVAEILKFNIDKINIVLEQLIPLLSIHMRVISESVTKEGEDGQLVELIARRDNVEIPIRDESDGVKKIVSILSLLIAVFTEHSITVAIDEIDAGIYEYLLGELLLMVQDSGKGQLIFTSHNLRPLEVLNKEFICFTTTNPDNRYYRLKGIGASNNLRSTYIREILMNSQDEELYKRTKKYKTLDSLLKAGSLVGGVLAIAAGVALKNKKD